MSQLFGNYVGFGNPLVDSTEYVKIKIKKIHVNIGKNPENRCPDCGEAATGEHVVFSCLPHREEGEKLGTLAS